MKNQKVARLFGFVVQEGKNDKFFSQNDVKLHWFSQKGEKMKILKVALTSAVLASVALCANVKEPSVQAKEVADKHFKTI